MGVDGILGDILGGILTTNNNCLKCAMVKLHRMFVRLVHEIGAPVRYLSWPTSMVDMFVKLVNGGINQLSNKGTKPCIILAMHYVSLAQL